MSGELNLVISIFGVVLAIIIPMLASSRQSGKFEQKLDDLKERVKDSVEGCEKNTDDKIKGIKEQMDILRKQSADHYDATGSADRHLATVDQILIQLKFQTEKISEKLDKLLERP